MMAMENAALIHDFPKKPSLGKAVHLLVANLPLLDKPPFPSFTIHLSMS
jgi:hypothetical protein